MLLFKVLMSWAGRGRAQVLRQLALLMSCHVSSQAEGELKCCGSSLFLKNRFGNGYSLVVAKDCEWPPL